MSRSFVFLVIFAPTVMGVGESPACGGVLHAPNGTITSPSFPEHYPPSKNCVWEIVAPPKHRITLNFYNLEIEAARGCQYDSVTVYSSLNGDKLRTLGVFCGSVLPPPLTSDSSVLRVQFKSDASVNLLGFAAAYYIDLDECAENNGGCQHECQNTLGGFECKCRSGFTLQPNKLDCEQDVTGPHETLGGLVRQLCLNQRTLSLVSPCLGICVPDDN